MTIRRTGISFVGVLLIGLALPGAAHSADRHVGYYYPHPDQVETYQARADVFADATAIRRIGFVTAITISRLQRPYAPSTAIFAKGKNAEKLIIVALRAGRLDTIYRVRAYLASLSAVARTTPAFQYAPADDNLTFFDLARMLGFEQITISDGATFTHQVKFQ